jgi:hypothetical protein
VLAVGATGLYAAGEAAISVLGLPGARRRFTGSYETASVRPEAMPPASGLLDAVPAIDPDRWRLTINDGHGRRELTLAQLTTPGTRVRATLDCTSGWYSRLTLSRHPGGDSFGLTGRRAFACANSVTVILRQHPRSRKY